MDSVKVNCTRRKTTPLRLWRIRNNKQQTMHTLDWTCLSPYPQITTRQLLHGFSWNLALVCSIKLRLHLWILVTIGRCNRHFTRGPTRVSGRIWWLATILLERNINWTMQIWEMYVYGNTDTRSDFSILDPQRESCVLTRCDHFFTTQTHTKTYSSILLKSNTTEPSRGNCWTMKNIPNLRGRFSGRNQKLRVLSRRLHVADLCKFLRECGS